MSRFSHAQIDQIIGHMMGMKDKVCVGTVRCVMCTASVLSVQCVLSTASVLPV